MLIPSPLFPHFCKGETTHQQVKVASIQIPLMWYKLWVRWFLQLPGTGLLSTQILLLLPIFYCYSPWTMSTSSSEGKLTYGYSFSQSLLLLLISSSFRAKIRERYPSGRPPFTEKWKGLCPLEIFTRLLLIISADYFFQLQLTTRLQLQAFSVHIFRGASVTRN